MTDPLDSSKPSAFNRLASVKVSGDGNTPKKAENSRIKDEVKLFREVAPRKEPPPSNARPPLNRLEDAVSNISKSRESLRGISEEENSVSEANVASTKTSVRDVDDAHNLAKDLKRRILTNQDRARGAQSNLAPEVVRNLLG